MKRRFFALAFLALLIWGFNSCSCRRGDKIPYESMDFEVKVIRFDRDLFALNQENIEVEVLKLREKHIDFFDIFCEGIIGIGPHVEPGFNDYLLSFLTDNMVVETYRKVQAVFPDNEELNRSLTKAFKRFHWFFPDRTIPQVYGFVSGFNNSVVLADNILGVGFDRYLGADSEYYPRLGIHNYLTFNMRPEMIVPDLMRVWAVGEFPYNDSIDNLLSNMIYEGQLLYFSKMMLPEKPDSLIFGFSEEQLRWCKRNEAQMWSHLVEHKLLFTTENFVINQYIGEAPFTQGFTRESPGRAARWLGFRIVSKFMERNKDFSLAMLMEENDYQKILNHSRYNP